MSSTNTVDITTNDSLNQNMVERCNYYKEVYVIEDELNKDNLIFEDNMEGYPPLHRSDDKANNTIIDRCDVYLSIIDSSIIFEWNQSKICEKLSQMTYQYLQDNYLIWSVGERDHNTMKSNNIEEIEKKRKKLMK